MKVRYLKTCFMDEKIPETTIITLMGRIHGIYGVSEKSMPPKAPSIFPNETAHLK